MSPFNVSAASDACIGLRHALDAAAISCMDPALDDAGLMHVEDLSGPAGRELHSLLTAGVAGHAAAPVPSKVLAPAEMSMAETVAVRNDLDQLLAGMAIGDLSVRIHRDRPVIHLSNLDTSGAETLTALLWTGLQDFLITARDLDEVLQQHDLSEEGALSPRVRNLRITLGKVTLPAAARFASLLDGEPVSDDLECPEYAEAAKIADRLGRAVQAAAGFMDVEMHYYCQKCGHDSSITLREIRLDVAQRLVVALQNATEQHVDLPL
ncbi:hypothetical protein ACIOUE_03785 [Streptomyces xanthochromogenes]|uniref:hypothetical protein n=1 Tax=Streptomyces TaxID=1883 RepID=UPI001370253E|nr:hypothetical protein [Streptomyces sp. SID1034]MYV90318.1 hypothetical protein [Streptomyces sp. SID1034]